MKYVLNLAKSADLDEMQHYGAFYLGLHCLPKYPFRGFQNTKGYYLAISPPRKDHSISTFDDIFAVKHKEVIFKS